jgi:hypothetical protein
MPSDAFMPAPGLTIPQRPRTAEVHALDAQVHQRAGRYDLVPLFPVRLSGVPFETLESLHSPRTTALSAEVIRLRQRARDAGERLLRDLDGADVGRPVRRQARKAVIRLESVPEPPDGFTALVDDYGRARDLLLRCTAELAEDFQQEHAASRATLRRLIRDWALPFSVFTSSAGMDDLFAQERLSGSGLPPATAGERKRERRYLLYLQRIAAKNDTMSAFGPTCWGRVEPSVVGARLAPRAGIARRDTYLEKWVVGALARAITADAEARMEIAPRIRDDVSLDGDAVVRADGSRVCLDAEAAAYLRAVDGSIPARSLGAREILDRLVSEGVVTWALEAVELAAHRLELMRDEIGGWSNPVSRLRWLAEVDNLLAAQQAFAQEADVAGRRRIMKAAAETAARWGGTAPGGRALYRGDNAIGEDCVRDTAFVLSPEIAAALTRDAAPWIDLWRDSYTCLIRRAAGGLRELLQSAPTHRGRVLLPGFLHHCETQGFPLTGSGLVRLAAPAVEEIRSAFWAAIADRRQDAPEWLLTSEDIRRVRAGLKVEPLEAFTFPSVDFQIAAASIGAIASGQFSVVISEVHAASSIMQHGLMWSCPDRKTLADALQAMTGATGVLHYGSERVSATAHTTADLVGLLGDRLLIAGSAPVPAGARTIAPARIEVVVDDATGDVALQEMESGKWVGSFARDWVVWHAFHPFVLNRERHTPRLRLGRVIVQRQSWVLGVDEFDGDLAFGPSLAATLAGLRVRRGLPRWVFARPTEGTFGPSTIVGRQKDRKPICVDLESILGMELLAHWVARYQRLEVTEMLPRPSELWWREETGRYSFEIRGLVRGA